ncbi:MAG: repeat-containing glycosyl hydrolase, partial [Deltaproteobacteria bacterium]|nr:repeat-containing glycosyl hydrolase [Deltaproteobacteria bacterium]
TGLNSQGVIVGEDRSDSTFAIQGVRVTGPTLGETLTSGSTHTITWETIGSVGPVGGAKLYYSKNGGTGWTLIGTVSDGTNSYLWTVPSTKGVVKNTCRIKVVLRDAVGKTLTADISDGYFTMQPAGSQ